MVLCLQAASRSDGFWFSASGSSVGCVPVKSGWLDLLGMLSYNVVKDLEFGTADAIKLKDYFLKYSSTICTRNRTPPRR